VTDPLLRKLAGLPVAEPDRARAARVRTRCQAHLARTSRQVHRPTQRGRAGRIWPPVVAGLGGLYLAEVIRQALQLYGVL
jgi:hypothetical protein